MGLTRHWSQCDCLSRSVLFPHYVRALIAPSNRMAQFERSAKKMLLDIHSPKSRAIFAAAHHLDALHIMWCSPEDIPQQEANRHIEALRVIAKAHFAAAQKIEVWLTQFAELFALPCASREAAKEIYDDLCMKLDSAEGFETVFI